MRTKKKYLAVLFIICMLAGCISAPESTTPTTTPAPTSEFVEGTNLLQNSGFEEGTDDKPDYWETTNLSGITLYRDTTVSREGRASASIVNQGVANQNPDNWHQVIREFPTNRELTLSGYIKTEDFSGDVGICVRAENAGNNIIEFATTQEKYDFKGTHDWTQVNTNAVIPSEAEELKVFAFFVGTGRVWFDDIRLIVGEEVKPPSPTPAPTPLDTEHTPQTPLEQKEWTLMFYDDADFYRAFNPRSWFEEEAYSGENLNVVVLEDIEKGPASTWYVQENGKSIKVKEDDEVNMGASQTLQEFIAFCKEWYPANRYYLFLYDHGMGWEGACIDITSENDSLSMDEIQKALTDVGGVDIIAFSGCVMGAVESAYELRDCVEIYIGSEEMNGYGSWGRVVGDICEILNGEPKISDPDLAKRILKSFAKYAEESQEEGKQYVTMTAVCTDKLDELVDSIDLFARDLILEISKNFEEIAQIHDLTESFPCREFLRGEQGNLLDLYDLADRCTKIPSLSKSAQNVKDMLKEAILTEYHDDGHPDAHGLTIYFPDIHSEYFEYIWDPSYSTSDLDFTEDTQWDEFLSLYYDSE